MGQATPTDVVPAALTVAYRLGAKFQPALPAYGGYAPTSFRVYRFIRSPWKKSWKMKRTGRRARGDLRERCCGCGSNCCLLAQEPKVGKTRSFMGCRCPQILWTRLWMAVWYRCGGQDGCAACWIAWQTSRGCDFSSLQQGPRRRSGPSRRRRPATQLQARPGVGEAWRFGTLQAAWPEPRENRSAHPLCQVLGPEMGVAF